MKLRLERKERPLVVANRSFFLIYVTVLMQREKGFRVLQVESFKFQNAQRWTSFKRFAVSEFNWRRFQRALTNANIHYFNLCILGSKYLLISYCLKYAFAFYNLLFFILIFIIFCYFDGYIFLVFFIILTVKTLCFFYLL